MTIADDVKLTLRDMVQADRMSDIPPETYAGLIPSPPASYADTESVRPALGNTFQVPSNASNACELLQKCRPVVIRSKIYKQMQYSQSTCNMLPHTVLKAVAWIVSTGGSGLQDYDDKCSISSSDDDGRPSLL